MKFIVSLEEGIYDEGEMGHKDVWISVKYMQYKNLG